MKHYNMLWEWPRR